MLTRIVLRSSRATDFKSGICSILAEDSVRYWVAGELANNVSCCYLSRGVR
jgi:hypothetical protein